MVNSLHAEPMICPQCGELIIALVLGAAVRTPAHRDLAWPAADCPAGARLLTVTPILL